MAETDRRWIRATLWIGLLGAALMFGVNLDQRIRLMPPEGAPGASGLRLADIAGGEPVELAEFEGQVVIVTHWASWCSPCREELGRLGRMERKLARDDLAVLAINVEGLPPETLQAVVQEWGIESRVVVPAEDLGQTSFAGEGSIPHSWLIDRRGRIRASKAGLVSRRSLERAVRSLLDEPAG